ncbi:Ig-like domain repeat protein [Streptomyces sp. NPDC002784]
MRSISAATSLAVLFSSAALSVVAAGPASAAGAVVGAPGGIVADGVHRRVFVGDSSAGTVVAADWSGAVLESVSGVPGVTDLALSDDGSTLYAASPALHEIVALDPATLDVKARYFVATDKGPRYVAFTAGKLWFSYGDQWSSGIGSVDPASGTDPVTLHGLPSGTWINDPGLLDTDPNTPGLLAVGETGLSSDSMAVFNVTDGSLKTVAFHNGDYTLNQGISDIDVVPAAPQVLVNGHLRDGYENGGFKQVGTYPTGHHADIAPDGLVAQFNGTKLAVFRPDATKPLRTYDVGTYGTPDLTWAPDSSRIFALVGTSGGRYTLKALTDPTKNVPTLTVNAPSTATRAKQLTVTGKISATVALPAGVQLSVTRTDVESPDGKALAPVTVKADGTYSFTTTPPAGGKVKYTVKYAGDAAHTAVSASDTVEVSRASTSLSLNNNGKLYSHGADVKFTAHLGTTYKNRSVEIWANPFGGDKPKKLIKSGTVNSDGNIAAWVDMTRDTTVTAVFKGDARYKPKTVNVTAYAKVKVSTAVSKHYKTAKIGSTTYYWFRKSTDPLLTTTMSYYPGRQQRFDLQVYYQGSWYSADSQYFPLGTSGKSAVTLEAPGESGIRARMRSVYVNGSSGDSVNSTTYGSWKYLYFSN